MYYKQCIYTYGDVVDVISQIRTHEYRLKYDESKYNNKTEVKNASQMKKKMASVSKANIAIVLWTLHTTLYHHTQ